MESVCIDIERGRTDGDGMEEEKVERVVEQTSTSVAKSSFEAVNRIGQKNSSISENRLHKNSGSGVEFTSTLPGLHTHTLYRRPDIVTRKIPPAVPKGELVQLKPRLVGELNTLPEHKKNKPPKFVPYEPYPGAVNPIVPNMKCLSGQSTPRGKANKNNLDIGILVSQMSCIRTQELQKSNRVGNLRDLEDAEEEITKLRDELKKVRDERDYFQGQLKFQTQVNGELKNLLVASVGEDLQTRVNLLTEDKLQLARALLDTANNLTTHTEQIEFLAGQCEVWRSKFLASSVMVEELARWKADLTHKNAMLNDATKELLHSIHQLREMQLEILKNLKFVAKIRYLNVPATDVFSLSAENLNILQQMVLHAGMHGIPEAQLNISSASSDPLSEVEKHSLQALNLVSQPLMATDEAIRALLRPYSFQEDIVTDESSMSSPNALHCSN